MKINNPLQDSFKNKTVVTIGTFDGVHIGHKKIVKRLIESAKKNDLRSVILTCFPHPRMVLQKDANIKLLNTLEEKKLILKRLGLDHLVVKKFTPEFSRLTAEEFVQEILIDKLNAQKVIIGYDHHFGRNRSANIDDLIKFGKEFNFQVEEISAQDINSVSISSTKIRNALLEGDLETANLYLGYNYMLTGTVIKGKGLGKQINFPTANLKIKEDYKLIPKQGVYAITCMYKGSKLHGMMNIGTNPTVAKTTKQSIEIHFFNFNKSLYDEQIQIDIIHRIRDEEKFDSVESLKKQLSKDKATIETYLNKNDH